MSELADYIAQQREDIFFEACSTRDLFWKKKHKMVKEHQEKSSESYNFLGVRVRAKSGWVQIDWIKKQFVMTKQGRKGFWNHISGRSRVSHKVPVSSIGRATDEVKRDFKECEERFAKARKRQADLKSLYRASMAYAKLYDPQLREELESLKDWEMSAASELDLEW